MKKELFLVEMLERWPFGCLASNFSNECTSFERINRYSICSEILLKSWEQEHRIRWAHQIHAPVLNPNVNPFKSHDVVIAYTSIFSWTHSIQHSFLGSMICLSLLWKQLKKSNSENKIYKLRLSVLNHQLEINAIHRH